jgi:hypothetical protein
MIQQMDFERVVRTLLGDLEREGIRYGAIGGFALGALGVPRATTDMDFLVHREDLERLHQLFTRLGYQRFVQTENVSHYRHAQDAWGSIDVLHAFRTVALAMLERARSYPIFGGTQAIKVLQAEDVIGLKVQAMANDPLRRAQEAADIEALMTRYGKGLDWDRIQEFYKLFELGEEARHLWERFGHVD